MILLYPNFDSTWKETYHDGLPLRLKRAFYAVFIKLFLRKVNAARNCESAISEPCCCKQETPLILVNNQLDAQFFSVYVYFNTPHVSSNHVLIIWRINCINTTSGICHCI